MKPSNSAESAIKTSPVPNGQDPDGSGAVGTDISSVPKRFANSVVYAKNHTVASQVCGVLRTCGVRRAVAVNSIERAVAETVRLRADCIFFRRADVFNYTSFLSLFPSEYRCFVAMWDFLDNLDAIDALNTGRIPGYIFLPAQPGEVHTALKLVWRRKGNYW